MSTNTLSSKTYIRLKILTHLEHHGPDYGYATRKATNTTGNIWTAFERLEEDGLIRVAKREKSQMGGIKIWYGITDAGRMTLRDDVIWFSDRWPPPALLLGWLADKVRALDSFDVSKPTLSDDARIIVEKVLKILESAGATK